MKSQILKPRVTLDAKMKERIEAYYSWKLPDKVLYMACFSHPDLTDHVCNPTALIERHLRCSHCNHAPGGICVITCHANRFCLSVFAYRLGIGGEEVEAALVENLKIPYDKLLEDVDDCLQGADDLGFQEQEPTPPPPPRTPPPPRRTPKETTKKGADWVERDGRYYTKSGQELFTTSEAAAQYGCSYTNMYNLIRSKLQKPIKIGKSMYIAKQELDYLINNVRRVKGGNNGE